MKVKDFIKNIEELGYNDDTEINICYCSYGGELYEFDIEEFEDAGCNELCILFATNDDYKKMVVQEACDELKEDLEYLICKWCQTLKKQIAKDK